MDDKQSDDDVVAEQFGTKVITDKMSFPYLMGATIDFVDTISQQGFTIDNPNATNSQPAAIPSSDPGPVVDNWR